jgi:Mg-chelatase subunit ChlD
MTSKELLTQFKRYNKKAREVRAKKLGYKSAADYISFLTTGFVSKEEKIVAPVKNKGVKASVNPTIHIVDVLDASGSMQGSKFNAALTGINQGIKELQVNNLPINYTYTLCDFSQDVLFPFVAVNPTSVSTIRLSTRGTTALYDAIGNSIKKINAIRNQDDKVLINVYTDGQENASREFNAISIAKLIKESAEKGITVTFVGTSHDTEYVIKNIHIDVSNTSVYDGSAQDLARGFEKTKSARVSYSSSVLKGEDVSKGFYKNINK